MILNLLAWDPVDERLDIVYIYYSQTGKIMFKNDKPDWYKRNRFLLRPVGINDINKREIYEGFILKGHRYENGQRRRFIGFVNYRYGKFVLDGLKQYSHITSEEINSSYEIIGNIYQNKELVQWLLFLKNLKLPKK